MGKGDLLLMGGKGACCLADVAVDGLSARQDDSFPLEYQHAMRRTQLGGNFIFREDKGIGESGV